MKQRPLVFSLICLSIAIFSFMEKEAFLRTNLKSSPIEIVFISDTILTKETLLAEIKKAKIKSPEYVFAQALLETGHLSCKGCSLDSNNLFGFRIDTMGYIKYDTWQESVYAYKLWQKKRKYHADYSEFLTQNWKCENIEYYISELNKIVTKIK